VARIPLPVSLVSGTCDVRLFLLKDGMLLSRSDVDLSVRKSPVQRLIYRAAQDDGLLYGIAAALIALLAGWLAAVVFNQRWRPCRRRTTSARCRRPPGGQRP
jgi:hypothetical protein